MMVEDIHIYEICPGDKIWGGGGKFGKYIEI